MKTRARLLSVVLAAAMVIGSAIPAFAAPAADEYHVELDQVGSFTKEGIRVYSGTFVEGVSDDEAYAYDMNGKKIFTDTIKGVENLEKGVYKYTKANGSDVNDSALVNADGKVLIPFEYAFYAWPGRYDSTQSRYILAYYGTEETESEEEALFYMTDDMIAVGGPGKNDTLYKGYAKIFDIQNEKFVDNLQFEQVDRYDTVNIVGNSILVQNADGSHTLYDSEGKKLLDLNSRVEANEKVIVERSETNSGCRIYDENGTEISKSGESISTFSSTSGYLYYYDSGKYVVIDEKGNKVLSDPVDSVYSEDCDIFRIKGDGPYIIIDKNGKELGQTEGDYTYLGYGRYVLETGVKTYTLTGPSGTLAEEVKEESYGSIYTKNGSIICFNDGTGFLTYDDSATYRVYGDCVLYVDPGNGDDPALYDMFSGKKLLDDGFSYVNDLGGRLVLEYRDGPDYTYKTLTYSVVEGK